MVMTMEWQPIETAPRDGTRIVAFGLIGFEDTPGIGTVAYDSHYGHWYASPNEATEYMPEICKVTLWLPLRLPNIEK